MTVLSNLQCFVRGEEKKYNLILKVKAFFLSFLTLFFSFCRKFHQTQKRAYLKGQKYPEIRSLEASWLSFDELTPWYRYNCLCPLHGPKTYLPKPPVTQTPVPALDPKGSKLPTVTQTSVRV